jgi:hypothetical protein
MGYMSEVGIKIKFADGAGREKIVAALGERWQVIQEIVEAEHTSITFHIPFTKWYTGVFEDVRALEQLVRIASERNALPHDDPEYVPSSGFFARIGEDLGDIEEESWDGDGLPCGFDLGHVETSIQFDY